MYPFYCVCICFFTWLSLLLFYNEHCLFLILYNEHCLFWYLHTSPTKIMITPGIVLIQPVTESSLYIIRFHQLYRVHVVLITLNTPTYSYIIHNRTHRHKTCSYSVKISTTYITRFSKFELRVLIKRGNNS